MPTYHIKELLNNAIVMKICEKKKHLEQVQIYHIIPKIAKQRNRDENI